MPGRCRAVVGRAGAAASRDVTVLAPVLTPEGWQLLNSLVGYRESEALAMSTRLRAEGHAPELVWPC